MNAVILFITAVAFAGCSNSGNSANNADQHSCAQYTLCTKTGNAFTCDCDGGTTQACPATANQSLPCDGTVTGLCMGCFEGATIECYCVDGGAPGLDAEGMHWQCIGGGNACR